MSKSRSSRPNRARREPPATPQTRAPFRASLPPLSHVRENEDNSGLHEFFPGFVESDPKPSEEQSNLTQISRRLHGLAERAKRSRSTERISQSKRSSQSAPAALQYENLQANESALLSELAGRSHGRSAARLYAFQAERASAAQEGGRVTRLLEFGRDQDESDPWIQFSLRVHAVHAQHWDRARDRLADEVDVTTGLVRQNALLWRATLGLSDHEDLHAAHAAAEEASERAQSGALPCLMSSEFHRRTANDELEQAMLEASVARSRESKPVIRERLAKLLEGKDDGRALVVYKSLSHGHPEAARVHEAAARVAIRLGDLAEAKSELALAAASSENAETRKAYTRAAVVAGLACNDESEPSLGSLTTGETSAHRATRACAMLDRGDLVQATQAAEAFARRATGSDRVFATALRLEAALAAGNETAIIRAARKAISYPELTPWIQALALAYEGLEWAQEGGELIGPDALAEVLFRHGNDTTAELERKLLRTPTAMVEHLIALDVNAELGADDISVIMATSRNALHAGSRLGTSLVLAHLLVREGQRDQALALLKETFRESRHSPLVGYQLAKLLAEEEPLACADALLATLDHAQGPWAAAIAQRAGLIIERAGGNPTQAYRLALDEHPAYFPAIWELERLARDSNDVSASAQLHRHAARQTSSPVIAGLHLVQAAILLHKIDTVTASHCIEEAAVLYPDDAAIAEMLLRLSSQSSGPTRALALEALASISELSWEASANFRAGLEWEHAKHSKNALAMFHEVSTGFPSVIVRRARDRIETSLGLPQGVAERLFEDVKNTDLANARLASLERLAHTDAWLCEDDASATMSMQSILEVANWHAPALRFLLRYYARHGRQQELREIVELLYAVSESKSLARLHDSLAIHAGLMNEPLSQSQTRWRAERERHTDALERLIDLSDDPTEIAALTHTVVAERINSTPLGELLHNLSEAEKSWPAHPLVPETMARIHEAAGEYGKAARAYERAAERACGESRRVSLRSRAGEIWLQDVADPIRAQRCFDAVLNERMRPEALRGLINALEMSRQDGPLLARLELETSLPHDPADLAWLLERLAERYRLNNEQRRELATRERLCDVDPESADAWMKWARSLAQNGLTQEAREPYEHAISLIEKEQTDDADARRIEALLEYATFLMKGAKNRTAARETLQQILQLDPGNDRAARLASELGATPGLASLLPPAAQASTSEPFPPERESFFKTGRLEDLETFSRWLQSRHEWELAEIGAAVLDLASGKAPRTRVRSAGAVAIRDGHRVMPEGFLEQPLVRFVRGLAPIFDARLKRSHTARKARRLLLDSERAAAQARVDECFSERLVVRTHSRRDTFCIPIARKPPFVVVSDSLVAHYDAEGWEHALRWGAVTLRLDLHPLAHADTSYLTGELRGWLEALNVVGGAAEKRERRALEALVNRAAIEELKEVAKLLESVDETAVGRLRKQLIDAAHRAAVLSSGCVGAAIDVAAFDGLRGPDRRTERWLRHPHANVLLRYLLSRDFVRDRRMLTSR